MKKTIVLTAALIVLLCMFGLQTLAAGESVKVYVTISDGSLALTQHQVTVTDVDGDGALTINDALYLAHEAKYNGGAATGYATAQSAYGLGISKLWGIENGGSYGYYVNNAAAMGLTDPVKAGDFINAYVITDTANFADLYSYFNVNTLSVVQGQSFTLTLSAAGYDENWAPVVKPVEGATILVDGAATQYKTDSAGKVTLKFDSAASYMISAKSDAAILVPPVCNVSVGTASSPKTGDNAGAGLYIALGAMTAGSIVFIVIRRRRTYEK